MSDTAPNIVTVASEDGTYEIVFWLNGREFDTAQFQIGDVLGCQGRVQEYRGRLQVKVSELDTITVAIGSPSTEISHLDPFANPPALEGAPVTKAN